MLCRWSARQYEGDKTHKSTHKRFPQFTIAGKISGKTREVLRAGGFRNSSLENRPRISPHCEEILQGMDGSDAVAQVTT
jgi:hypothetical protein